MEALPALRGSDVLVSVLDSPSGSISPFTPTIEVFQKPLSDLESSKKLIQVISYSHRWILFVIQTFLVQPPTCNLTGKYPSDTCVALIVYIILYYLYILLLYFEIPDVFR